MMLPGFVESFLNVTFVFFPQEFKLEVLFKYRMKSHSQGNEVLRCESESNFLNQQPPLGQ